MKDKNAILEAVKEALRYGVFFFVSVVVSVVLKKIEMINNPDLVVVVLILCAIVISVSIENKWDKLKNRKIW